MDDKTPAHQDLKPENVLVSGKDQENRQRQLIYWAARVAASGIGLSASWDITDLIPRRRAAKKKTIQEQTTALVKELSELHIDPVMFDVLLSNEINRRMKLRFGVTFLVFTFLFTAVSYAIVILDAIHKWGISPVAITSLIIETPIQFVGLLYIIARNLFPNTVGAQGSELVTADRQRTTADEN